MGDPDCDCDSPSGPTALRIALGGQRRRRREAAGSTREDAGGAIRASAAKISPLELGRVGFTEHDVVDLLAGHGVVPGDHAAEPGWWQRYHDLLPGWAETYLGLEQAATLIRSYEVRFVPGLPQTECYAREVTRLTSAHYIDKRSDVEQYAQVMDRLCAQIEPLDRTAEILDKIRAEL